MIWEEWMYVGLFGGWLFVVACKFPALFLLYAVLGVGIYNNL